MDTNDKTAAAERKPPAIRMEGEIPLGDTTIATALASLAAALGTIAERMDGLHDVRVDVDLVAGTIHFFALGRKETAA